MKPPTADWANLDASEYASTSDAPPPALAEDLGALNARLLAAVLTPWPGTCIVADGSSERQIMARVAGGAKALRGYVGRSAGVGSSAEMQPAELAESGSSHLALVEPTIQPGTDTYPPEGPTVVTAGGLAYDAAPSTDKQRLLVVTGPQWQPRNVDLTWRLGCSVTLAPVVVEDASVL